MSDTVLLLFDQMRSSLCILTAYVLVCIGVFPHRRHFYLRLAVCVAANLALAALWLPLYELLKIDYYGYVWLAYLHYIAGVILQMSVVFACYEVSAGQTLFRCLTGSAMNVIPNTLLRYLFVNMWFPELPEEHFVLYILLFAALYAISYGLMDALVLRGMRHSGGGVFDRGRGTTVIGVLIFFGFSVSTASIQTIIEYVLVPIQRLTAEGRTLEQVVYFSILVMIIYALLVLVLMYFIYGKLMMQQEQIALTQIMNERRSQYEFTRENMDLINRKSHDMRHQLAALEIAGEDEREALIEDVKRAIQLYDASFATGNDVLDTILTEKNLLCQNRGIRLSCIANAEGIDGIKVVDLYTLLGNALDNAIESVSRIEDESRRIITVRIENLGKMIHIIIENFYDGEIEMKNGYPVTIKADKENHGFGVRSMQVIAQKYGGDIRITAEGGTFALQILLAPQPVS